MASGHLREVLHGTAHVERGAIIVPGAIRASLVVAALLTWTTATGQHANGIPLAVGAFFVAVADSGETVGHRWRTMAWTTLWLMLAAYVAALVSEHAVLVVVTSAIVAAATGIASSAGPRAALGALLALVTFTISAGAPELPAAALDLALLVGLGGVAIMVVTVLPVAVTHPSRIRAALEPPPSVLARIRPHLTWSDPFARHAARLALVIAVATTIAELTTFPHDYWLPMTVAWVTKPDVRGTVNRVAARVAGTVIGLALCAVLLLVFGASSYAAAAIVAISTGIAVAFIWANYSVAVAAITVLVVVLFATDGDAVGEDLVVRLAATLLAAVIAVLGSYVWRTRPPVV